MGTILPCFKIILNAALIPTLERSSWYRTCTTRNSDLNPKVPVKTGADVINNIQETLK